MFVFLFFFSLVMISVSMASSSWLQSFALVWELQFMGLTKLKFILFFDLMSLIFLATVSMISASIFLFSHLYMISEKFFLRFHLILLSFIFSMFLVIVGVSMEALILGWDGLGVSSYLLVIHYQSWKSYNAGLITALSNRVGDAFIMLSVALMFNEGSTSFSLLSLWDPKIISSMMLIPLIASLTKSAQIPFSAWLPAAMAAPTPVSALVHSSTLVTAGVYLMIRFKEILTLSQYSWVISSLGCLTMIMAGLAALKEMDMKKIVALSTLSQLGLMMSSLGLGLWKVAFFHLVTHAFMKALLFVTVGNSIHYSNDYQDLRKVELILSKSPLSFAFMLVSNLGLCGTPFLAGFYSKDLWLEMSFSQELNLVLYLLFLVSLTLTVTYSARMMGFMLMFKKGNPYMYVTDKNLDSTLSMWIMWTLSIPSGAALSWFMFKTPEFSFLMLQNKLFILDLLMTMLCISAAMLRMTSDSGSYVMFNMWALPLITSTASSHLILLGGNMMRKFVELSFSLDKEVSLTANSVNQKSLLYLQGKKYYMINMFLFSSLIIVLTIIF